MITLNYVHNESRRFQTYLANQVGEIRDLTNADQWRHCPGKLNPDDVSRGLEMNKFLKNEHWLKGPSFLRRSEDHWPETNFKKVDEKLELRKEVYLTAVHPTAPLNCLLFQYSSWNTLLRTFARILKFLQWLKWSAKKKDTTTNEITRNISQEEIEKAK